MVITLSRQVESGGDEIAEIAAREAGLRVADRMILEQMAQQAGIPVAHVRFFDEAAPGAVESLLVEWQTSVSHAVYLRRLVHTLLALEREGNVILIGRGAAFVLMNPGTLHVRVIAPLPCRVARMMERQGLNRVQAERVLRRSDEERARFVQQSFGAQIDNPAHYDLVLNTAELSYSTAAEIIVRAGQRKWVQRREEALESAEDIIARVRDLQRRPQQPRVSRVVWQFCQRRPQQPMT